MRNYFSNLLDDWLAKRCRICNIKIPRRNARGKLISMTKHTKKDPGGNEFYVCLRGDACKPLRLSWFPTVIITLLFPFFGSSIRMRHKKVIKLKLYLFLFCIIALAIPGDWQESYILIWLW